ncbi:uncharacterized protein LOC142168713 isoform X2 [Nicotiana tabacum]|uniref:Uncharacterized protein LOC142168713 isoform X2 n=1 Tax=Nicotiana tabacum TaxID=4097 RepID=A0AC58SKS7_TOBAC
MSLSTSSVNRRSLSRKLGSLTFLLRFYHQYIINRFRNSRGNSCGDFKIIFDTRNNLCFGFYNLSKVQQLNIVLLQYLLIRVDHSRKIEERAYYLIQLEQVEIQVHPTSPDISELPVYGDFEIRVDHSRKIEERAYYLIQLEQVEIQVHPTSPDISELPVYKDFEISIVIPH